MNRAMRRKKDLRKDGIDSLQSYYNDSSDTYIKSILASRSNLTSLDIPQFLVESKRQQLQLKRTIKRRK